MPTILNGRELASMEKSHGRGKVVECLEQVLADGRAGKPGGVMAHEFSVRDLFEHLVPDGREALRRMDPRQQVAAMEADAVDTSFFSKITGQLIYSRILEAYASPAMVFSRLIPTVPTQFIDGEKIAGLGRIGDESEVVPEGDQFPRAGFSEEYIETPSTQKRGMIVSVTREAIFADRTGLILRRAAEVGEWLAVNKEKRCCDVAIGATNNYKRNGTSVSTYQTATPWINDHSNPLVDWTDIENAELLFSNITDPNTGEPVVVGGMNLVCTPWKYRTALRVLNATEVRFGDGASSTSQTVGANPVVGAYPVASSQYMYSRLQSQLSVSAANAKEYWLLGDFAKAFGYMEVFPLTVVQAPQNSYLSFERDIVAEFKASERGVAVAMDPRYVTRNKN
jgi:hypothetical protein